MSSDGARLTRELSPQSDFTSVEAKKKLVHDVMLLLRSSKDFSLEGWNPLENSFSLLKIKGSRLSLEQSVDLAVFCQRVIDFTNFFKSEEAKSEFPILSDRASSLPNLVLPLEKIKSVVDLKNSRIRELPSIKVLRQRIESIREEIGKTFKNFTTNSKFLGVLQSDVPVLRSGRQVLAVKTNKKFAIPGIEYEVSNTGATTFIEPESIVRKNNDLVQVEFELAAEISRILADLTSQLSEFFEDFCLSYKMMTELDSVFSIGIWGIKHSAVIVKSDSESTRKKIRLFNARHPIFGEKAVPIDVVFDENVSIMMISGPNTGGKTATLKTVALFAMLNQCGFPLPVSDGSEIPIFDKIFALIGDDQSLTTSLSTFGSHLKTVATAIKFSTPRSLVLLDELGSGTDPQQGAALAMAVLDFFCKKESTVMVTTHHDVLKNYAFSNPRCMNCNVEFDKVSSKPIYKLISGKIGESFALEIAAQNGFPSEILVEAGNYLGNKTADIRSLIRNLNEKTESLQQKLEDLKLKEENFIKKEEKLKIREEKLQQRIRDFEEGKLSEAENFISENRKMLENLVRFLREGEITREKTRMVKDFIKSEENFLSDLKEKSKIIPEKSETDKNFSVGDTVKMRNGLSGTLQKEKKNGLWTVQVGSFRMDVESSEFISSEKNISKPGIVFEGVQRQKESPEFELSLLGLSREDALSKLEKQIDLAVQRNFLRFSVIHGKGNGILQGAVCEYLKSRPEVASFKFALPEDGGTGKTYVVLQG
ncbi:MAG: Smr/MutS family protein [Spirochaetaceae bacterium]|nr:Smr/MutS family protein [Spirochaetaceae bacterium]